ncbi:MAG: Asp-tRNA(Asn)/Glu-tRNA(Gln) amidotransferase subunit GatC [Mycobacterium sp.]
MSQISRDEVAHLARLARLALTESELDSFVGQLDAILGHVSRIQAVDVTGVEATDNPLVRRAGAVGPGPEDEGGTGGVINVFRPDVPRPSLTQEQALAAAPEASDERFAVPRILGEAE